MPDYLTKYGPLILRALLSFAFIAAGGAKLLGDAQTVAVFDKLGFGQWFRYVTALIEFGGAVLLWVPGRQAIGAGLLLCTMIGAVLSHLLILGPSAVPALFLGLLAAVILYLHRGQLSGT